MSAMIFRKQLIKIKNLNNNLRKLLLILTDLFCVPISVFCTNFLTRESILQQDLSTHIFLISFIAFITYYFTGQYKGLSEYLGSKELYKIIARISIILIAFFIVIKIFSLSCPSLNFFVSLWVILSFLTGSNKFILRDLLTIINRKNKSKDRDRVFIYGAGAAAVQLASAIIVEDNLDIVGFIDDNPELWGRTLKGVEIFPPSVLKNDLKNIKKLLFAISAISKSKKKKLLNDLQKYGLQILQTPSVKELTTGKFKIDELRPLLIEDLLGRDVIIPKTNLLGPDIQGNVICVTGAGGSIGTELCRQIINLRPKLLILFEISEASLFKIHNELVNTFSKTSQTQIKCILGSAFNKKLVMKTFLENKVDVVFHAAAYKHVPLVQENPLSGLFNNIFSTKILCDCASKNKLRKFVLISSDKAVRPTNIMGISKRISELVVQAYADEQKRNLEIDKEDYTNFCMVRFGNVLNSSGSVVPLFREQISKGGPITLTHPKVIRYFMTIPEAAQLVIQASTLSKGGEVFLLDMGDPINIKDLAIQMVKLSGMTIKNKDNQEGDIEIKVTGLRPGEKLYEELLIDGESQNTSHPLIFKANEKFIKGDKLWSKLNQLNDFIEDQNTAKAVSLAISLIPENEIKIINK